jgi:hypothetical protein
MREFGQLLCICAASSLFVIGASIGLDAHIGTGEPS